MSKCKKCGAKMVQYYGAQCPICQKPEFESIKFLNFVRALNHIVALDGNDKFKDRFWDYACEQEMNNDSYLNYCFADTCDLEYGATEQRLEDEKRFKEIFGIDEGEDSVTFWVSW